MRKHTLRLPSLLLVVSGMALQACSDGEPLMQEQLSDNPSQATGGKAGAPGAAGSSAGGPAAGGSSAGSSSGGSSPSTAGSAGAGGEVSKPPTPGQDAKLRLVNLLAGAPEMHVDLNGKSAFEDLAWPGVTAITSMPTGTSLLASAGGKTLLEAIPSLDPAHTTQVALLGVAGGPSKLLSLPPSDKSSPRVRVVHAAPKLHDGQFRLYSTFGGTTLNTLSFGEVGTWADMATADPTQAKWSLTIDTDNRSAYFKADEPITGPTTLYVASSADEELFVYAVAEDGASAMNGFTEADSRLRLVHAAGGVGSVSFTLNDALIPGGPTNLGWGTSSEFLSVPSKQATIRAVDSAGTVLASAEYDLKKFEEVSFALVGGPGQTSLLPLMDGWSHLKIGSKQGAQVRFIDARPPGASDVRVAMRENNGWTGSWKTFVSSLSPGQSTDQKIVPLDSLLFGFDLGLDGTREYRFDMGYFPAETFGNFFFAHDDQGQPWLLGQWPGGGIFRRAPLERTALLRVWNLDTDTIEFSSKEPTLYGDWSSSLLPTTASQTTAFLAGDHEISVGGKQVPISLDPMTDVTLVALPGGESAFVASKRQIEDHSSAARLLNTSGGEVSASFDGATLAGKLKPGAAGPELPLPDGYGLLSIQRPNQPSLSYRVSSIYPGGASLLAYGGDPSWPTVRLLQPGSSSSATFYPEELSARVRVVAVMSEWHNVSLRLDDATKPLNNTYPQSSGTAKMVFSVTDAITVPAGAHTLHLGDGLIDVDATLAPGSSTLVLVMPDLSSRLITLPSEDSDEIFVANATINPTPTRVVITNAQDKPLSTVSEALASGHWVTAPYPGNSTFAAIDIDLDGALDWRSLLPVLPGSLVLVIGAETEQAVVCVKGGWAGIWGKDL